MRIRLFILVAVLVATGTVMAQAYRWVDENGVIHFSDRPREGAERIILPSDNRISQRATPEPVAAVAPRTPAERPAQEPVQFQYESLDITSPGAEETLWNIAGILNVSLALQPGLQDGHQIRLYFDGNPRDPVTTTSFQIEEVWRGVHNIQAEVVDASGKLMIRSQPNRFYVQQSTIN